MAKDSKKIVLLDAHAIIHRAYHGMPDFTSSKGEPTGALYGLSSMLIRIATELKPDYVISCYDLPQKTFRHEAYDAYKAGRKKTDPALVEQIIKSRSIFEAFNIPMYDAVGFEADDILGTIVEQLKDDKKIDIIIASGDMDTMQLIDDKKVQVYTLKKGINDTILYDEDAIVARFGFKPALLPDYKGLRGDTSDNIIGIKGIGEKTAGILISHFGTIENIYKQLKISAEGGSASGGKKSENGFKKLGLTDRILKLLRDGEEEAEFSKTLATIRRDAPIVFQIPDKNFQESFDMAKVEKLFNELEFRSFTARLKTLFGSRAGAEEKAPTPEGVGVPTESVGIENVDPDRFMETAVALWLTNSELTNPTMEDILSSTRTDSFEKAREVIFENIKKQNLTLVYEEVEKPILPIVKGMQDYGILIDKGYFKDLSKEYHKELDKLTAKIYKMAGTEFNLNSPKQLAEVLFEKMGLKAGGKKGKAGNFSTKVSVLEELEDGNPIITEIMSYRELQKLLSTYIDVIPNLVAEDGRLHAKFIQNGSTTGRFSSQDPNLQNIPIKSDLGRRIRGGFVAKAGSKLAAFDYSQIELRVCAILSGDKTMAEIFRDGKDIHTSVASFVYGVPLDQVDHTMRRAAKVINFGIIYGMGVNALKKNLGGTREEAQKFYDNYFRQFSRIKEYMEEVKSFAVQHLYTETLFGRKRMFPAINSRIPFIKNMAERTATNAPLQGTAADIIKLAIRFADEDLKKAGLSDKVHLVLQIHDELVYEIEDAVLPEAEKIIHSAMCEVLSRSYLHYKTDIPLEAHYGHGQNFGAVSSCGIRGIVR